MTPCIPDQNFYMCLFISLNFTKIYCPSLKYLNFIAKC